MLTILVDLLDDLFEGGGGDLDAHHAEDVADRLRRDVTLLVPVKAIERAAQHDDLLLLQASLLLRVTRSRGSVRDSHIVAQSCIVKQPHRD